MAILEKLFARKLFVLLIVPLLGVSSFSSVPQFDPHPINLAVQPTPETKKPFSSYRDVSIGMKADDVRKSLGEPKSKSDEEDFYMFGESESLQILYDAGHLVTAISVTLFSDLSKAPSAKDVLGEDAPPGANGGIFKTVRYPKAGFWVSYSKTAGDSPTISITIQKI